MKILNKPRKLATVCALALYLSSSPINAQNRIGWVAPERFVNRLEEKYRVVGEYMVEERTAWHAQRFVNRFIRTYTNLKKEGLTEDTFEQYLNRFAENSDCERNIPIITPSAFEKYVNSLNNCESNNP